MLYSLPTSCASASLDESSPLCAELSPSLPPHCLDLISTGLWCYEQLRLAEEEGSGTFLLYPACDFPR